MGIGALTSSGSARSAVPAGLPINSLIWLSKPGGQTRSTRSPWPERYSN